MNSLETRPEDSRKELESVKAGSSQFDDYVSLMKANSDVARLLPQTPADKNLPALLTENCGQKERVREGSDFISRQLETKGTECVDDLLKKFKISMDQQTDPELMKDILHNDMKLDDCPAVMKLLGSRLTDKESMKPMLETIRNNIITKNPALHEFINAALNENLIPTPDESGHKLILRALNHMVLLDTITKGMAEDYHLQEDVRNHIMNKRKELGIRDSFLGSTYDIYKAEGTLFGPAKTKTMDVAFDQLLELRRSGQVSQYDVLKRIASAEFNFAEAILSDEYHGYSDNARAGVDLARHPFSKVWLSGDNRFVKYNLDQEWNSLYGSWDLAFMAANLPNPQIFFPKLLIPQVMDAKPEEFLFNRVMALWLTANFYLFEEVEKKPETWIPGREELAKRWGEINLTHGKMLDEKYK